MEWHGLNDIPLMPEHGYGLMGILNITPDSFSDGGQCENALAACIRARQMVGEGAHILDIGAESTRPGAEEVEPAAEMARLRPVLNALRGNLPVMPLSVDTRNSQTARLALELGASVINDVSGLGHDGALLDVVAQYKPGYVLMHSQGEPGTMQQAPHYEDVVGEVQEFFARRMRALTNAGLPENRIVLDPGIGFGKTVAHNLEIIRRLPEFTALGRPLLVGISRKSIFGAVLGLPVSARDQATATASALLYERGAIWHRVHNVAAARQALELARIFAGTEKRR